jgi:hypothetical protein
MIRVDRFEKETLPDLEAWVQSYPADAEVWDQFSLSDVQTYNPVYDRLFSGQDNSEIGLNHPYRVRDLGTVYKSRQLAAGLVDEVIEAPVHVKFAPLLDPIKYMIGKYDGKAEAQKELPRSGQELKTKLGSHNNYSYVDNFFCYLSSRLLHDYGLPHGIDYYGSVLARQKTFRYMATDDMNYLNESDAFHAKLKDGSLICHEYADAPAKAGTHAFRGRLDLVDVDTENIDDLLDLEELEGGMAPEKEKKESVFEKASMGIASEDICLSEEIGFSGEDGEKESMHLRDDQSSDSDVSLTDDEDEPVRRKPHIPKLRLDTISPADDPDPELLVRGGEDSEWEDVSDDEQESMGPTSEGGSNRDSEEEEGSLYGSEEQEIMVYINDFPVQAICLQRCDGTLDELFDKGMMNEAMSMAYLFQVVATLYAYQKAFGMTHNDLHTNNIMYINTDIETLYYRVAGKRYAVPTYGRIMKIIDFGRSIYRFDEHDYVSDSFSHEGDAHTQYNFEPYYNPAKPKVDPSFSFDLCRLGTSLYDFVIDHDTQHNADPDTDFDSFQRMVHEWCQDDEGRNVLYKRSGEERYPEFKLYKMIARTVSRHTPEAQFKHFTNYEMPAEQGLTEEGLPEGGHLPWIDIDRIPKMFREATKEKEVEINA